MAACSPLAAMKSGEAAEIQKSERAVHQRDRPGDLARLFDPASGWRGSDRPGRRAPAPASTSGAPGRIIRLWPVDRASSTRPFGVGTERSRGSLGCELGMGRSSQMIGWRTAIGASPPVKCAVTLRDAVVAKDTGGTQQKFRLPTSSAPFGVQAWRWVPT